MTTFVKWIIMKITDEPAILVLQVPQLEMGVSYMGGGCIKKITGFCCCFIQDYLNGLLPHSAQNSAKNTRTYIYIYINK